MAATFRLSSQRDPTTGSRRGEGALLRGLLLMLTPQVGAVPGETGRTLQKIRTTDKIVSEAIRAGALESATFASLVEIIERSNTIVYVARTLKLPHRMEGCLVHGGRNQRYPYLRVLLRAAIPPERMIAILAHELRHVREVLDAGGRRISER